MKLIKPQVSIEEALKEPEKWIPEGVYCYSPNYDGDSIFDMTAYLCPFWDKDYDRPHQENGYCHYLNHGDWEDDYMSLLRDQCKECGINDYDDEDYVNNTLH